MEQNIVAGYKELSQLILEKDPEWAEKQEAAAKAALKENGVGERVRCEEGVKHSKK